MALASNESSLGADYVLLQTDSAGLFTPFSFTLPIQLHALNIAPDSDIDACKVTFTDVNGTFSEVCGVGAPISTLLQGRPNSPVTISLTNPRKFIDSGIATWFAAAPIPTWNYPKVAVDSTGAGLSNIPYPVLKLQAWVKPTNVLPFRRIPKQYYYTQLCAASSETVVARIPAAGRRFIRISWGRTDTQIVALRIFGVNFNHTGNDSITILRRALSIPTPNTTQGTVTFVSSFNDAFEITVNNASINPTTFHFSIEVRDEPTYIATEF